MSRKQSLEQVINSANMQARVMKSRHASSLSKINEARTMSGLNKMDDWTSTVTAQLMENMSNSNNQAGRARYMASANEATQSSDVGFLRTHGINILASAVPNLIAHDLVSVQPLD